MSHYTCLVVGRDVEGQLEPFNENTSVERYKAYWDNDHYKTMVRMLQEPTAERRHQESRETYTHTYPADQVLGEEHTLEDVRRVYMARYEYDEDDGLHLDDGGLFEWSTYNPKSKWDWWEIGGRWTGYFKLREDGDHKGVLGNPGTFKNAPKHDADQALKGAIAIDWMRDQAGARAAETWDRIHAVIGHLPVALGWEEHYLVRIKATDLELDDYSIEQAREDYHAQERVVALKEWNDSLPDAEKVIGWFGPSVEDFQFSREEFIEIQRSEALCPFSYLKDGEWREPGKMGWFGQSSDDATSRRYFRQEFNQMLDALPNDTLLTICDLHI